MGVILFALYILQLSLGTAMIRRRLKHNTLHPPRNIVHIALGLIILILSLAEAGLHAAASLLI